MSLQTSDMGWRTWTGAPQNQEHQLSVWLLHSNPDSSCTKGVHRPFHAGSELLLCQASRPGESWGSPKRESQDPTLLETGRDNTRTLPSLKRRFPVHTWKPGQFVIDFSCCVKQMGNERKVKCSERVCFVLENYLSEQKLLRDKPEGTQRESRGCVTLQASTCTCQGIWRSWLDVLSILDTYLFEWCHFSSQSVRYLHELIHSCMNVTHHGCALTSKQILCVALHFFANQSFLYK